MGELDLSRLQQGQQRTRRRPSAQFSRQNIVNDLQSQHQVMLLVDGADHASGTAQAPASQRFYVFVVDPDFSGTLPQCAVEQPKQRGFTRTARADQRDALALLYSKIDAVQRDLVPPKQLAHVLE